VQLQAWVSVDGVFGRTVCGIGVDGLVGTASYDEDWTLFVRWMCYDIARLMLTLRIRREVRWRYRLANAADVRLAVQAPCRC